MNWNIWKLLSLAMLGLGLLPLHGQNEYVDSLLTVAEAQEPLKDRLEAYGALVSFYRHRKPDSATYFAWEQLAIAEAMNIPKELGVAYSDMAKTHYMESKRDSGLLFSAKAFEYLAETNDLGNQADVLTDWGSNLMMLGRMGEAKEKLAKGLKIAYQSEKAVRIQTLHYHLGQWMMVSVQHDSAIWHLQQAGKHGMWEDPYDASSLWFTTAMVYFYQAKLDSAKVCLKRSVSVVDTLPYPNSRCVSNLNLAFLHNIIGQPVTALEYAQAALTDAESIADVPLTAMVHQIFSYTFLVLRKPELCIQYGEQALKIGKHQMIAADLALLYMTVAQAYYLKQNIAKGDAYLDSSHQINERIEDPQGLYQVELTRAQMALEVQQEPEKALRILRATTEKFPLGQPGFALNNLERKAIEIRALFMGEYWEEAEAKIQSAYQDASFQQITQLHLFAQLAQTLLLAHKGDKAAAIQQLLAYEQQRDSLYQGQAMERTSRLETQFKVQNIRDQLALTEKEKQLAEEEKTLVRQRWQVITLAVGAVGSILLALALVFFRSRQRARRDAAHIRELSKEVHHRTKNNLQMLNSLLNLQMDRQPEGSEVHQALDSTKTRVAAISRLHHLLYDNDQLTRISLPELVQNLTKDLRETAGLTEADVQIQTAIFPIQVDAGRAVPLTLILNEWLTNAFKYAVPTTEAPTILIEFKQLGNERMMLVFSDNGPGYDPSQRREGSYGTDLVRTMVRQLHGHLDMNTINGTQYLLQFRNPTTS